mgnify:CR=1 FL=1
MVTNLHINWLIRLKNKNQTQSIPNQIGDNVNNLSNENKDLNNSLNEKGKGSSSTTNVVQTQSNSNNDKLNDTTENDKNAHDRKKGK